MSQRKSAQKQSFSRPLLYTIIIIAVLVVGGGALLFSRPTLPALSVDAALVNTLIPQPSANTNATIYYPSGWAIREELNELAFPSFHIAPNEATLDAMTIPDTGGILSFSLLTSELMGVTANSTATVASLLELQNRGMADIPGATQTEATQTFQLGEWEMARQVYRIEGMGDPYVSIQSLLKQGDTFVSASAFTYETQSATTRPLFDAILSKITVTSAP